VKLALDGLYPRDTFNLITFAGDTHVLFPQPVPATTENIQKAQQFLLSRQGGGGTEMMKAIRAALDPSDQQDHVRIVCFLTDGYVGNDMEIVDEVKRHPNARVFSFGIGSSVNRFLLDKMAEEGRGEVEYVMLNDDGSAAAKRFHDRVRNPLLTDITLEWVGLAVTEVYPKRHPDLFAAKPLVITGRYDSFGAGKLRVRGKMNGRDYMREIPVAFPADEAKHDVLATLWARTKIEDLMSQDWTGIQVGNPKDTVKSEITQLGLDFRLMTQFTSFVAVEESIVTTGGEPRRVEVPVEMPHGVSYEGIFGKKKDGVAQGEMAAAPSTSRFSMRGMFGGNMASPPMGRPMPTTQPMPREEVKSRDESFLAKIDTALHAAVHNGGSAKVKVKIWLTDDSAAVLDQLKKLGVEVSSHKDGKMVLGRIAGDKLEAVALLEQVLFISRDIGNP
jgi:Ca-activated chloride channel family protein